MLNDIFYLVSGNLRGLFDGLITTVILSTFGTFVGLFLGIFIALGKSLEIKENTHIVNKIWMYPVRFLCNVYSIFFRGTPMMVQAMIFKYGFQAAGVNWAMILPGVEIWNGWFFAGLIVITLNTTAYMGEIVASGLNGVDRGQLEGARSLGMNPLQALFLVTLPQAIRNVIPTIGNEWIVNIKDSSVLNVISVAELFFEAKDAAASSYKFVAAYVLLAFIYLILTLIATGILKLVELKLDGKTIKLNPFKHYDAQEAK